MICISITRTSSTFFESCATSQPMTHFHTIIRNGHVLEHNPQSPFGVSIVKKDIGLLDGWIHTIDDLAFVSADKEFDATGLHVLPGLIDTQVHFREPGSEHKENLMTGTRSALLGGITAVFEMPNTHPSTTTVESFQDKIQRAQKSAYCDYAFYMGACQSNLDQLHELENLPGCCGIKVFLGSSTGSLLLSDRESLKKLARSGKKRIAAHCENEELLKANFEKIQPTHVSQHPEWRNEASAFTATQMWTEFCLEVERPTHVLHVTSKKEMEYLQTIKEKGPISVEVTPQHLTLFSPDCYENLGTRAQMNPPIRSLEHQEALWAGLKNKTVDIIGSDHAPHTLEEKRKPYPSSPSGMPGVQTLLPIMLDHVHHGRLSLEHLVQLLSVNPVNLFNIKNQGLIAPLQKANLTLVDLKKEVTLLDSDMESRCRWTPFHNKKVTGFPVATFLHGELVMKDGQILAQAPCGEAIEF